MPNQARQFEVVRRVAGVLATIGVVAAAATIGFGVYHAVNQDVGMGILLALGGFFVVIATLFLYYQVLLMHKLVNTSYRTYDVLLDTSDLARVNTNAAQTIAENSLLSEWAKRIIYREKDYEFLRDTIHAAIVRQDWDAAEHLIADLQEEFGYADEAQQLRAELEKARSATTEEKVQAAVKRFEMLCAARKWTKAEEESKRLKKLFPDDRRIDGLPRDIEHRKNQYKRELLKAYEESVRLQNVDRAHDLLFELDKYLSPNESAALKESARGVFKAKCMQMGVQFRIAIDEKNYKHAIDVGTALMREFPNTRYAQEIEQLLPTLHKRVAGEPAAV